ncbi:MAG: GNAT family N-acetyltransferase [Lapillicoccus sp.]
MIRVVPASAAAWEDLQLVLGTRGPAGRCQCQRYKLEPRESFASVSVDERRHRLREQTDCGPSVSERDRGSGTTSGLVAYLDPEPVGWCAVEPRTAYAGLVRNSNRAAWVGRTEDRNDDGVWAVTCFVTRAGYRKRGVSRALTLAAVAYAREQGARAIEGYPLTTGTAILEELHVGTASVFADAGLVEVSRPSVRRVVMRMEL